MMMGVAMIDFERNTYVARTAVSPLFPIGKKKQGPVRISERIKGDRALPLFVVLGIEFVKVLNGEESVLPKEVNAMEVAECVVG